MRKGSGHGLQKSIRFWMGNGAATLFFVGAGSAEPQRQVELGSHGDIAPRSLITPVKRVIGRFVSSPKPCSSIVTVARTDTIFEPLPGDHDWGFDFKCQCRVPERAGVSMSHKVFDEPDVCIAQGFAPFAEGSPSGIDDCQIAPHRVDEPDIAFVKYVHARIVSPECSGVFASPCESSLDIGRADAQFF